MNYTLFIADLHLEATATAKISAFKKLLRTTAKNADAVYILGDLFQVWIGDDDNTEFAVEIRSALKDFTQTGIPTYICHGNHDFLIGKKFCADTGCMLIPDPTTIELYGESTLICHGDIFCTNDMLHTLFRKIAYKSRYNWLFLKLPLSWRTKLAQIIVNLSKKHKARTTDNTKSINLHAVTKLINKHKTKQLIHGHTHKADIFAPTKEIPSKRITLGGWDNGNYSMLLYYEDHSFDQTLAS